MVRPGALTASAARPPGSTVFMMTGYEWRRPRDRQDTCPDAWAKVWPGLLTPIVRRATSGPTQLPVTPATGGQVTRAIGDLKFEVSDTLRT